MPRWLERVDDRVLHRGRRPDGGRLADALRAERVERRRRLGVRGLERRELGRARERVLGERRRERVAVVVVDEVLPQRLRDPRCEAAVHLPVDEQRVEDAPAVVDRDVTQRHHHAGVGVDLDDGDVRAERERRARLLEVVLDVQRVALLLGLGREVGP